MSDSITLNSALQRHESCAHPSNHTSRHFERGPTTEFPRICTVHLNYI